MTTQPQPLQHSNSQPVVPLLPLEMWGATDKGRQREGNEDSIYPESGAEFFQPAPAKLAQKGQLLVVADGMGGAQAGSEASRWTIRVAVERYYDMPGPDIGLNLKSAVEIANNSLYQYLQSTGISEAGCTMTAAVIHNNMLYVANVGDSRAYLIRSGQIRQLTRDHTVTQQKVDQGLLRPEHIELDPDRNVITRSMGTKPQVQVDLFPPIKLASEDVVLLCSDGLTDMLADAEVLGLTSGNAPKRATKRLIDAANKSGGFDNISVILAQVGGKPAAAPGAAAAGGGVLDQLAKLPGKQLAIILALLAALLLVFVGIGWVLFGQAARSPAPSPSPGVTPTLGMMVGTATATPGPPPAEETPAPGGKATSTPLPSPSPSPTPKPVATSPGGGTPSKPPVSGNIRLVSPADGTQGLKNPFFFMWEGTLTVGQNYRLVLHHIQSGHEMSFEVSVTNVSNVELPAEEFGEWNWWVQVIGRGGVIAESEHRTFGFSPVDVSKPANTPVPGTEPTPPGGEKTPPPVPGTP